MFKVDISDTNRFALCAFYLLSLSTSVVEMWISTCYRK